MQEYKKVHSRFIFQGPIVGRRMCHAYREEVLVMEYAYSKETLYQEYIEVSVRDFYDRSFWRYMAVRYFANVRTVFPRTVLPLIKHTLNQS